MKAAVLVQGASPEAPQVGTAAQRRAVIALARIEAVRLLRHPVTIIAVAFWAGLCVSQWFTDQANQYPVLQDVDRNTELGVMFLMGGAALVAGNLAVLREHRNGTAAVGGLLVLPYPLRTAAHLLAVLPLAVLAAALAVARTLVLQIGPAAGHSNPYELATGPATVLLFGALGVLLGRLTRSAVVAPLALLAVFATLIVFPSLGGAAQWLQPVVPQSEAVFTMPAPAYLIARPAGPHLAYLLGIGGIFASVALLRSGTRAVRVTLTGAVALAVAIAGGVAQTAPPSQAVVAARSAAMYHPARHETCRSLGGVTYCAFPDFVRWIPSWNALVQRVLARVPATVARQPVAVRQRIIVTAAAAGNGSGMIETFSAAAQTAVLAAWQADDRAAGTPGAVTATTRWGDSRSAANFAAFVAYRLVTGGKQVIPAPLPSAPAGPGPIGGNSAASPVCGGAAGVLIVWLAGQASAASKTGLRLLAADQGAGPQRALSFSQTDIQAFSVPGPDLTVALEALARPSGDIAARVLRSWGEMTSPHTTAQQAAQILGVPAPQLPSQSGQPQTLTPRLGGSC